MKNVFLILFIFIFACSNNNNTPNVDHHNKRSFQFTYEVLVEPTSGRKLEMWIPVPKTNEVQIIDNIQINSDGLNYTIEEEVVHNNKYLYINEPAGTQNKKAISLSLN